MRTLACLVAVFAGSITTNAAFAAEPEQVGAIRVSVAPDKPGWTYALGEKVSFQVRVTRDGHPLPGAKVHYEIGPEQLPPTHEGTADVPADGVELSAEPLAVPGFLRCVVELKSGTRTYRGVGTAGFAPEAIKPITDEPKDFDAFWDEGKKELAGVPLDLKMTPAPERSTAGATCFHINVQNIAAGPRGTTPNAPPPTPSRLYGILCEPEGRGPFPALLSVPGAGVRAYRGMADTTARRKVITLTIGIHGIPVNLDDEVYRSLEVGALSGYPGFNLDDKRRHYYRRVFLGTVRANDVLAQHPKWDKKHLVVTGGSQGGALSIVTAALDPRVKALVSYFPALADHAGFLKDRTGGWPFYFRREDARMKEKLETAPYFDVVNFARRVKVQGLYSWGFNDETCPPTTSYAVYNVIKAPKRLVLALETGHATGAEQNEISDNWLEATWKAKGVAATPAAPRTAAPVPPAAAR